MVPGMSHGERFILKDVGEAPGLDVGGILGDGAAGTHKHEQKISQGNEHEPDSLLVYVMFTVHATPPVVYWNSD